jgi:membrane associated rhomboid family serine protease
MSRMAQPETTERTVCYRHPRVETAVRCSDCDRPICTDCMVFGPVGIRCPECAGVATGPRRAATQVRSAAETRLPPGAITIALITINVIVYLAEIATGSGIQDIGGEVFQRGALFGPLVAEGEWYRLISGAFLHAGLLHLAFNMLALWWFGRILEGYLGHWRFLGLYLVSALAGSAGALLMSPDTPTVGASGAVFGIFGAALVIERHHVHVFGGAALPIVVLNLVFTFTFGNISIGGHLGGLVGGILVMIGLWHWGRGRHGDLASVGVLLAVAALSVIVAYFKVRGLT